MPSQRETQSAKAKAQDLPSTKLLKGHVAIVTGADSGIGQAIAIAFAKAGADVAIPVHKDKQGARETLQQVEDAGQRGAIFSLDQADLASVTRFYEQARDELGVPTLLVNNAGVDASGKHVKDIPIEEMRHAMETNFFGPFYFSREFLRGIDGSGKSGVIINITSVHQEYPRAGAADYDCSKGALRNLTRTLALETAEMGVRVVNIAPGMVLTPFNQPAIDDAKTYQKQTSMIPMKRAAEPEEIATMAVVLASDWASYVHGSTVFIDGGLAMQQAKGA